ncbi:TPA: cell envelope integrity TolA C-terminal domain-containing protein [Enterobacter cancerogenus]|nr:cell envelope biogenesis protein TolA [Enterobacter chengduensis]
MNKAVVLGVVLALAGCQKPHQEPFPIPFNTDPGSVSAWAAQFQQVVKARMGAGKEYAGKACSLKIHQPKEARYVTKVEAVEGGDPALCRAVSAALRSASEDSALPAAPYASVGEDFTLDFLP